MESKQTILAKDIDLFNEMQKSPLKFIEKVWGLYPQPAKPEYKETVFRLLQENRYDEITAAMFGDYDSSLKITNHSLFFHFDCIFIKT